MKFQGSGAAGLRAAVAAVVGWAGQGLGCFLFFILLFSFFLVCFSSFEELLLSFEFLSSFEELFCVVSPFFVLFLLV